MQWNEVLTTTGDKVVIDNFGKTKEGDKYLPNNVGFYVLCEAKPKIPTANKVELYDFGTALDHIKTGSKVTRNGWNGKDMFLELQRPDENSKMTKPYIYMNIPILESCVEGGEPIPSLDRIPWIASQADILEEDWIIL